MLGKFKIKQQNHYKALLFKTVQKVLDMFLDVLDSIGSPYFDFWVFFIFFPHGQVILLLENDWAVNFIFRLNVIPL